ncbi:hypothetical protein AHAS_Ahas11G0027100 [Arachis hypogaea]|uniref:Phospholipase D C-terminal domain-containing protein n=1 Tax=Arachis hypogaea TaxID=3818 RepID=A0A445AMF9_ARAHY|nr:hypothetical protein Ahy_B01g051647 [Arachis hypogaea]
MFRASGEPPMCETDKSLSEHNWRQYAAVEVTEMKSHLLKYPIHVDSKGNVGTLHGWKTLQAKFHHYTGQ